MKRILSFMFSVLFSASLSFAVVGCQKAEEPKHEAAVKKEQVLASDLHLCEATGSRLTAEDCRAAESSLKQSKKGTAALKYPTWMMQGQTRTVILAIGNAPPPEQPAETQPEPHELLNPDKAPKQPTEEKPKPYKEPTPHQVVDKVYVYKKSKVIDYYPFIGKRVSAELTGTGFTIKPLFPRSDQLIVDDAVTTWEWEVTANDFGDKTLIIKTAVAMINSQGKVELLKSTTEYKPVTVWIGSDGIFKAINSLPDWLKVVAAILAGVAAVVGAWKSLKALFGRS